MKHTLRICLLAAAALASACTTIDTIRAIDTHEDFKSSGSAKMDNSLGTLALSVNGNYDPAGAPDAPTAEEAARIQQFGQALPASLASGFAEHLRPYGVALSAPGRGVPLLRLYIDSGRSSCEQRNNACGAEAHLEGNLVDSNGHRAWWFSYWVEVDHADEHTYDTISKRIVDAMAKDQVVTPD